ncbi:retrovirus-related Pol polyprotein from transposon 17.6 [Trichonephila clavipes]|nr:retrovirus-related Pol polyprotein from transposon 17.6 [Trichonephila clavipes]
MSEKALVDHIFVRLEPQVQDYVEVRNPQTAIQLLEVLAKFEERYSCKTTLGSRNSDDVEGRGWKERRVSNVGNNRGNWRNSEVVHIRNNDRNDYRGNYQNNRQENQWFESRNRFLNDVRRFKDRGYQFRNQGQNNDFSTGDQTNRGSREHFSRGCRKQMGRLNVLKVSDVKDSQINKVVKKVEIEKVEIDLSKTKLEERQKRELQDLFNNFQGLFSDKPGLTHVLYHEIDTGDNPPVVSRLYRYDRVKQEILDYHVDKMLKDGTIIPTQSPYASPVVLCRKNNGYPLPLIDDLIMNIHHTDLMSALDLRSGYFQMAVNPSDIIKTEFVTKNGTYAFRRMPLGLSGVAPNFQKAIDSRYRQVCECLHRRCNHIISIIHSAC